jgi:hypothetical protein
VFRNLLHAYTHAAANGTVQTFWGACGVVRRDLFCAAGGFSSIFRHPSIEDVELGWRMSRAGALLRVVSDLRVKHQKVWTLGSMMYTDAFRRARPWARLAAEGSVPSSCLARRPSQQLCSVIVCLCVVLACFFSASGHIVYVPIVLAATLVLPFAINYRFFRFYSKHPQSHMLAGICLLAIFYLSCGVGTLIGLGEHSMQVLTRKLFSRARPYPAK